jgi:hypothetical protein
MGALMFDLSDKSVQTVCLGIVTVGVVAIAGLLVRVFRRSTERSWPAIYVGLYNIVLLLLYLLGAMTQIRFEGWGFLPLIGLTLPWSLCMGILAPMIDHVLRIGASFRFPGSSFEATLFIHFVFFNVLCGSVNSCILYALLRRRWRAMHL